MTIHKTIDVLEGDAAVREGESRLWAPAIRTLSEAHIREAAEIIGGALAGNRLRLEQLTESLSTSDFRILFGQFLETEMLQRYDEIPPTWTNVARRVVVGNFKPKTFIDLLGGRALLDPVAQLAPYPLRTIEEARTAFRVGKLGARIELAWEMLINDELDAFKELPEDLAVSARDTEQATVTKLFVNATGLNTDVWKSANKNLIAGNPVLSAASLEAAISAISMRRDSQNRPIVLAGAVLTIPPSLEVTARRILGATEIRRTDTVTGATTVESNPLAGIVTINVDPWLPVINTSGTANTTWFLTPATNGRRPAMVLGFLRGHETPDLRVKSDTGTALGGGSLTAEQGSFDGDGIAYRVRHVLGGGAVDMIASAASTGAGA